MAWNVYRWIWRLESPLHIGWTPAGAINRTRLYIPARAMWAALTAEIARRHAGNSFPDYQGIGQELQERVRFTYLFPAEKIGNRWLAWLPRYEQGHGLRWHRERDQFNNESNNVLTDRRFRQCLLATQAGTAIDPASDAATEGTLREVEYIASSWRHTKKPVVFVGYVFVQDGTSLHGELQHIQEIWIGGEGRYGFGRLCRMRVDGDIGRCTNECFGIPVDLRPNDPIVKSPEFICAHTLPQRDPVKAGAWEVVLGWDTGNLYTEVAGQPCWAPGSQVTNNTELRILRNGLWQKV